MALAGSCKRMTSYHASIVRAYFMVLSYEDDGFVFNLREANQQVMDYVWGKNTDWDDLKPVEQQAMKKVSRKMHLEEYIVKAPTGQHRAYEMKRGPRFEELRQFLGENPTWGVDDVTDEMRESANLEAKRYIYVPLMDTGKKGMLFDQDHPPSRETMMLLLQEKEYQFVVFRPGALDEVKPWMLMAPKKVER